MNRRGFLKRLSAVSAVAFVPNLNLLGSGSNNIEQYSYKEYHTFDSFFDETVVYHPGYMGHLITWSKRVNEGDWYYSFLVEEMESTAYKYIRREYKSDALRMYKKFLDEA